MCFLVLAREKTWLWDPPNHEDAAISKGNQRIRMICRIARAAKQFVGCRKVNSKKTTPGDNRNIVPLCVLKGENLMLRQTIAELIVLFFCYSVAGWCMEVILKYIQFHRFINRGFLIGPYCPIYGSGAVVVTVLVGGLIGNASYIVTFLASFVLCGVLEYFVSWYMEKMFHARWWDYSQKPMNLHGRIWIGNLVLFGIGGVAIVKLIDPVLMKWIHAIPQWILYTLSGAIVMLMIWDNIVSHIAFNLVKKEIDGVEADNSEEVSTKVRQLLREDPVLLRRIGEAYPNLEVKSKELAKKLKAQAEAVQESVEEKKQAVADAVAEGKLAAEAAAEERRLAAEERKQLVQEAVEEKKIAFEEKKQAVALAVSKAQQKRQSEEAFRARMKKADQKKREEKIRKGNKK